MKTSTTRSQVAAWVPTVLVGINRTMQMVWIVTGTKSQSFNLAQFKVGTNRQIVKRTHSLCGDQQSYCKANAQYEYLGDK